MSKHLWYSKSTSEKTKNKGIEQQRIRCHFFLIIHQSAKQRLIHSFSAVIKTLNSEIVQSFFTTVSVNQAPCQRPVHRCVALLMNGRNKPRLLPHPRLCQSRVASVRQFQDTAQCGGCSLGGGTTQWVSSTVYGRVNNIEPLKTRFGGRNEKQDKGVASCAAPPVHTVPHTCPQAGVSEANRPQRGRLLGRRCAGRGNDYSGFCRNISTISEILFLLSMTSYFRDIACFDV